MLVFSENSGFPTALKMENNIRPKISKFISLFNDVDPDWSATLWTALRFQEDVSRSYLYLRESNFRRPYIGRGICGIRANRAVIPTTSVTQHICIPISAQRLRHAWAGRKLPPTPCRSTAKPAMLPTYLVWINYERSLEAVSGGAMQQGTILTPSFEKYTQNMKKKIVY